MYLKEDLHNKLVEDFKLIIKYLEKNVAPKIIEPCKFQLDQLDIIIFPIKNNKRWLSIEDLSYCFTIKEFNDIFYLKSYNNKKCRDLFEGWDETTYYSDEYLYKFVSNWNFIKERCNVYLKSAIDVEFNINNFKI